MEIGSRSGFTTICFPYRFCILLSHLIAYYSTSRRWESRYSWYYFRIATGFVGGCHRDLIAQNEEHWLSYAPTALHRHRAVRIPRIFHVAWFFAHFPLAAPRDRVPFPLRRRACRRFRITRSPDIPASFASSIPAASHARISLARISPFSNQHQETNRGNAMEVAKGKPPAPGIARYSRRIIPRKLFRLSFGPFKINSKNPFLFACE